MYTDETMESTKKSILLVEDDEVLLEMYSLKLTSEGYDVWTALNGKEGLAVLEKQGSPALILLDVMMPVMDGFAMLERVKAEQKWKSIPVVLLSNLGQKEDIEQGKRLGAVDYLVKAKLIPAQVVEKVKEILK